MKLISFIKNTLSKINSGTDLVFLIFLLLVLNVSLAVKLLGVIFIYVVRPDFKFKLSSGRLPLFYVIMILLTLLETLLNLYRGFNYVVLAGIVATFWLASFMIIHQLKLAIEKQGISKVVNALNYFLIINLAVSAFNLIKIMVEIGEWNPYTFDGLSFKYSASTGDYIKGVTRDISTVNMIISAFSLIFYLHRKNYVLSTIAFLIAMFTTSNLGNVILIVYFFYILIFSKYYFQKSLVLCYIAFMIIFIVKISPSNLNYINYKTQKLFHLKKRLINSHFEDHSQKEILIERYLKSKKKVHPIVNSNTELTLKIFKENTIRIQEKETRVDTNYVNEMYQTHNKFLYDYKYFYGDTAGIRWEDYDKAPGKYFSFVQTFKHLSLNGTNLLLGTGGGNFSSKLAYKASNLGITGMYVNKLTYVSPEFKRNHLKTTLTYYLKDSTEHSIINFPNSVLNQLLGEYGLIGFLVFLIFYVGYYLKRFKMLTFGKFLLPICLLFMLTDYWFESISIMVIFELLMFIDLSEKQVTPN